MSTNKVELLKARNRLMCLHNTIKAQIAEYEAQKRLVQDLCSHDAIVEKPRMLDLFDDHCRKRICTVCLLEEEDFNGVGFHRLTNQPVRIEHDREAFEKLRIPQPLKATVFAK